MKSARDNDIKEYGLGVVLDKEQYWLQRGFTVNYEKDLLVKLTSKELKLLKECRKIHKNLNKLFSCKSCSLILKERE